MIGPCTLVPVGSVGRASEEPLAGPVQENLTASPGSNPVAVATYELPLVTWEVVSANSVEVTGAFSGAGRASTWTPVAPTAIAAAMVTAAASGAVAEQSARAA